MARRKGWGDFNTAEKLEALRDDVAMVLDMIDKLSQRLSVIEDEMRQPADTK